MRLEVTKRNVEVFLFRIEQGTGYTRNNPLRFVDEDGNIVVLGQVKVVPYNVSGTTLSEARANANSHFAGQYAGRTTPTVSVDYRASQQITTNANGTTTVTDTVTSDTVHLDQTIELPSWSGGTADEQKAFAGDVANLKAHEEGHVEINKSAANALDKSLPGTTGKATAAKPTSATKAAEGKLDAAVGAKTKSAAADRDQKNNAYDAQTGHVGAAPPPPPTPPRPPGSS